MGLGAAHTIEQKTAHLEHSAFESSLSGTRHEASEDQAREKLHQCLEHCLDQLPETDRELILVYYQGVQRAKIEGRTRLAKRLGLSMNALSIRACRIRDKLEACIQKCCREV